MLNQTGTGQAEPSGQVLPAPRGLPFEKGATFGLFSSHKANMKHAFSKKISIICLIMKIRQGPWQKKAVWVLKGFALGVALLIPGLSAGTLALVMGIYEKTLVSLTQFIAWAGAFFKRPFSLKRAREKKPDPQAFGLSSQKSGWFLLCLFAGASLALLFLARPLAFLIFHFSIPLYAFFMGLIVASIPSLFKMTGKSRKAILWIAFWTGLVLIGFKGSAVLLEHNRLSSIYLPEKSHFLGACLNGFLSNPLCSISMARTLLFLSGFLAVFAGVLPGLSGSWVLLLMGTYPYILESLANRALLNLAFFTAGGLLGLLLALFMVRFFLKKHRKFFFCMALGIIIASLPQFIPYNQLWSDGILSEWMTVIFFTLLGMGLFFLLDHKRKSEYET